MSIRHPAAPQLLEKAVSVEVSQELPVVPADRIQLVEVFDNLITNAIKYACDGPAPRVEIGCEAAGHETRVFVRDSFYWTSRCRG